MPELTTDQTAVVIRSFLPEDEPAVIALWQRAGVSRAWNNPSLDIHRKSSFQPNWFLLAVVGSTVVGTVMIGYEGIVLDQLLGRLSRTSTARHRQNPDAAG